MRQSNYSGKEGKVSFSCFPFGVFRYIAEASGGTRYSSSWPAQLVVVPVSFLHRCRIYENKNYFKLFLLTLGLELTCRDCFSVGPTLPWCRRMFLLSFAKCISLSL
jgi:hypothetical protein